MLANNVLAVLGGTLMGLANATASYEILILGRFLIGAYSGTREHHSPAMNLAFLHHTWASKWEWAAVLSPLFFPLLRANIRPGAHVRGGNCPHSPSRSLRDTQPTGHRHWYSDCPGN